MPLNGEGRITLDEFLARAPHTLSRFAAATKSQYEQGDATMDPNFPRVEAAWWRDVAAYLNCVELGLEEIGDVEGT